MKIFAVSDMHGMLDGLDPSGMDIVVIAGDFSKMNGFSKWHLYDQKKWIEKNFFAWTSKYPETEFIVVPGNHDLCLDLGRTMNFKDFRWDIQWPKNVHMLIDREVVVKGLKFYGMPWVPIISYRWAFEADKDKIASKCSLIPNDVDVLVTHAPPHWFDDKPIDHSTQFGMSEAFGSSELTDEILDKQPKFAFCGHIHTGYHDEVRLGDTSCFNVSRVDEQYEISYEPRIVEVEVGECK